MALSATNIDLNSTCRDKAIRVQLDMQKLVQSASQITAAELAVYQTNITALKTALTAAGAA